MLLDSRGLELFTVTARQHSAKKELYPQLRSLKERLLNSWVQTDEGRKRMPGTERNKAISTLVAMHYPNNLAIGAADHTYVMCGTREKLKVAEAAKQWPVLRSASGNTVKRCHCRSQRARRHHCYLINGKCHQQQTESLPAGILSHRRKGYVFSALYGRYGGREVRSGHARSF